MIYYVEDDPNIRELTSYALRQAGFEAACFPDAEGFFAACDERLPDLVLLDIMLPGMNGFDLCGRIRAREREMPIIFLSAKSDIVDKSIGFRAGGDDYVTKPFDIAELLLRIEAHLRRRRDAIEFSRCTVREGTTSIGDLEIRFDAYQVLVKGKPANLTAKEFEIVAFLATYPGKVFTRGQIQEYIWGDGETDAKSNSITVFVRKIREKIEENPSEPKYLLTVPRVGYKMTDAL